MSPHETLLGDLIDSQRKAIWFYGALTAVVALVGILILCAGIFLIGSRFEKDPIPSFTKLAGLFVSTLSAVPLRELHSRTEKLKVFRSLRVFLKSSSPADLEKTHELIWGAIEKIVER